jgi:hypothetical protein
MSSTSTPIPLHRFAQAINDLPLSNLHLKAAELHNSIAHLESSNQQLKPSADSGDQVCFDAIGENLEVIGRMEERIALLRQEVERRGFLWEEGQSDAKPRVNGQRENHSDQVHHGGSFTDEELALRLQERMREERVQGDVGDMNDGVYL